MRAVSRLLGVALVGAAAPAYAGPPYLTDDPAPTDRGHWEIYAFGAAEGGHSIVDSDVGLDLNYGAAEGVQLTATLPASFSHERSEGWHGGSGDVELGVKYRFLEAEKSGFSAAVFPRAILPTSAHSTGERTRFLLPLWLEQEFRGGTSLFGGGGYVINPGTGNRNFWQAAVALTHELNQTVSVGAEIAWQSAEVVGETGEIRAGVGSIIQLSDRYALLFSAGPTRAGGQTGYHAYFGLGLNF
jgi:hypothetical protein